LVALAFGERSSWTYARLVGSDWLASHHICILGCQYVLIWLALLRHFI